MSGLQVMNDGEVIRVKGFNNSKVRHALFFSSEPEGVAVCQVTYRTTEYKLDEIVFRKASETEVNGASSAMEAHLIHRHNIRTAVFLLTPASVPLAPLRAFSPLGHMCIECE